MASDRSSSSPPESPPESSSTSKSNATSLWPTSRRERIFTTIILGLFGVAFGLGLYTFSYAKGFSYLSDDPTSCVNCHIMREQFEGWSHSSHQAVATCNDCHTPHRFPDKWVIKGVNGWNHSVAFTTGNFPEPIMIRGFNARIAQENCVDCHQATVTEMHLFISDEEMNCVACHGNVGHNNAAPRNRAAIDASPIDTAVIDVLLDNARYPNLPVDKALPITGTGILLTPEATEESASEAVAQATAEATEEVTEDITEEVTE